MRSLQRRVLVGGLVWALLATVIGALAVLTVFDQITNRTFNEALREQHTQVLIAFANADTPDKIETWLMFPDYERVYSGRYWQVANEDGQLFTSRSLFDFELTVNPKTQGLWEGSGPQGPVRGYTEQIVATDGSIWTITVATSLSGLAAERSDVQRNVAMTFGFVALLGVACAAFLTTVLLAPIRKLGLDVLNRWDTGSKLAPEDYPLEVAPLVTDINELIQRNHDIHDRGRRQAADLAHALKTPSAALRNELVVLSRSTSGTVPLFEALDRIDAQIARSLARMRAASVADAVHLSSNVGQAVSRLERLFRALPDNKDKVFEVSSLDAWVAVDPHDLEEMLGNLLENAFKWCASTVQLSVRDCDGGVDICVMDDGPGIPVERRQAALQPGGRLDTSMPGTGIGLSIVDDLAAAYGGSFELSDAELGGLRCCLVLPYGVEATGKQRHSA